MSGIILIDLKFHRRFF